MQGLGKVVRAGAALAAAVAFAVPSAAQAQSAILCNGTLVCAGVSYSLVGGNLVVDVRNFGTSTNTDSFITGFGFYGLPTGVTANQLLSATYTGVNPAQSINLLSPALVTFGAPGDLQQGAGTQPLAFGVDFGNNGLTTCGSQQISSGITRYETCANEFARFTFSLTGALTAQQLADLDFAFRTQGIGPNDLSDKCFSTGDADCSVTLNPPGGIGGGGTGSVVPEPSTYALMATGLVGLVGFARRRRQLQG